MESIMDHANENDSTLLMGAAAIAAHLGITRRQAYRLVYDTDLPTFRLGGTVAARKASLAAWIADQERAAA
jgi:predicted DNA-binding transcriptional regulator AlpA